MTEHLIELLNDGDCLIVEDDIAATALLIVIGNAFDTILIQKFRRFLLSFHKVADRAVNVHSIRFRQRIHDLRNDFCFAKATHIPPVFKLLKCQSVDKFFQTLTHFCRLCVIRLLFVNQNIVVGDIHMIEFTPVTTCSFALLCQVQPPAMCLCALAGADCTEVKAIEVMRRAVPCGLIEPFIVHTRLDKVCIR